MIVSPKMFESYIRRHLILSLYATPSKIILKFKNWTSNNRKKIAEVLYFLSLKKKLRIQ